MYTLSDLTSKVANSRGWMNLNDENVLFFEENDYKIRKIRKERHIKLCMLKFKPEYDYIIWNKEFLE